MVIENIRADNWEEEIKTLNWGDAKDYKNGVAIIKKIIGEYSKELTLDLIMLNAIKQCQGVLAEWIVPDSKTSDADCLNKLLGILDDKSLVIYIKTIEASINKTDMEKAIIDIERAEKEQRSK